MVQIVVLGNCHFPPICGTHGTLARNGTGYVTDGLRGRGMARSSAPAKAWQASHALLF